MGSLLLHALLVVLASGQGRPVCWSHDFSYERCCVSREQDRCWHNYNRTGLVTYSKDLAREFCCSAHQKPPSDDWARHYLLQVSVFAKIAILIDCLTQKKMGCEQKFVEALLDNKIGDTQRLQRWLREVLQPSEGFGHSNARDRVSRLQLARSLLEALLVWDKLAFLRQTLDDHGFGGKDWLLRMNRLTGKDLVKAVDAASQVSWRVGLRQRPRQSDVPVHIALVASVGKPVFAAKAMATVRSALFFARKRPLHFHLFADGQGVEATQHAVKNLEPQLASRASRFEIHGEEILVPFFQKLKSWLPAKCLGKSSKFGDSGWLRLFANEVFRDRDEIETLVFVDAGDYVFLADPALMLEKRAAFEPEQFAGGPYGGSIPVQVLDLERMRVGDWTKKLAIFVDGLVMSETEKICDLGEGWITGGLALNALIWHNFDSHWAVEPREFIGVQGHTGGMRNVWSNPAVWKFHIYPGLRDWTKLKIPCPRFAEYFVVHMLAGEQPPDPAAYNWAQAIAFDAHHAAVANATLGEASLTSLPFHFPIRCNNDILGIHFALNLKAMPWARAFLNFWAGSDAWGADHEDFEKRAMTRVSDVVPH
eukprot:TRINITY_DN75814_c0_g1_i1.p1 TRINITY_DN75814_c0_g1~~TRINITY_DN75814_c0_g1_i1.p1  ORF type:complete len:593 (-),score=49.68 TRINITY_DN75814_c0_g1_i1:462-2240(-)